MISEASPARKALTAVVLAAALFAAVVIQLTAVNRIPLPGATAPDLVLLLVTAIAVFTGPATGAVTGFAGGLALDTAPPAAHYAGQYALVFCLAGYAAARVMQAIRGMTGEHDPITAFTVMAGAAAAGEAGKAALGMLLSDPNVTSAAVSRVLPGAVLYDLLLAPLVFLAVAWVTRGIAAWNTAPERAPAAEFGHGPRLASVFRQASAGAAPNLRLAGTGENYTKPPPARRIPKLRLSEAGPGSSLAASAASPGSVPVSLAGRRTPRLNFAGSPPARTAARAARTRTPGKNWLRQAAPPPAPPAARAAKRPVRGPARGWLRPAGSAAEALAARSAPSGLSALSGAATPLARRRAPSRGWLRVSRPDAPSSRQPRSPRSGWLGSARRPRSVVGSGVGGRGARANRYEASQSGAWLRRGRHPWRRRSRRLLRFVGVGR